MAARRDVAAGLIVVAALGLGACTSDGDPEAPPPTSASPDTAPPAARVVGPLTPEEARALATMNDRLKEYLDLHTRIERSLPRLPDDATPDQIDQNQRTFEKLMREARAGAKPGDIFTAEARPVILRLLASVFGGPDGRQLKSSIQDENPVDPASLELTVNSRYPDTVPLATMPPEVLQTLPELAEDLEYRFIGDWLILLDTHAHLIADLIEDALPKS
jgi:hypothetical protein